MNNSMPEQVLYRWKEDARRTFQEGWLLEIIHDGDMVRIGPYAYSTGDWFKRDEIEVVKK